MKLLTSLATALAISIAGLVFVLLVGHGHKSDPRAECVKMCEPRLVEEYSSEMGTCHCGQVAIDLPGRCEATCLPRLVRSWDKFRGACECEPMSTWGQALRDPKEIYPLWYEDAGLHTYTPESP